ncbi:MAG: phosphopyruvate hydratase, partial [Candidatus Moranbacteria bacterium GW2011_GWF1_36_4]
LDGTENKSRLGANAILGVSLAVCRAAAMDKKKELYEYISDTFNFSKEKKMPFPMFNILNGGQHSDSGLCVQEFKLVPDGIEKYCEQLRAGSEIFYALKKSLTEKKYSTGVGDEGGFAPRLKSNSQALEIINTAIKTAGYEPGKQANIGLDVAANSFFDEKRAENIYYSRKEKLSVKRNFWICIKIGLKNIILFPSRMDWVRKIGKVGR